MTSANTLSQPSIDKCSCSYYKCYCEENCYKLIEKLLTDNTADNQVFAVFISNENKAVPIWEQASAEKNYNGLALWDYHVIVAVKPTSSPYALIYDLDTLLPFPCCLSHYAAAALKTTNGSIELAPKFRRLYRIIPGEKYLEYFSSDRSHMKSSKDGGSWIVPPPEYSCIKGPLAAEHGHTLPEYWTMKDNEALRTGQEVEKGLLLNNVVYGVVAREEAMLEFFEK